MKAYTYIEKGKFALTEKSKPEIQEATDAIVRVTLGSICTSDLHIKYGPLPDMYGKNLTFKTGDVYTPLITHSFPLCRIEEAYRIFENKEDGVIKIAIHNK